MFWCKKSSMRQAGDEAPQFSLPDLEGHAHTLAEGLQRGHLLLAFFKISCPTCQFTFPFIQRLSEKLAGAKLTIWGISQDDRDDTKEFCREFEIGFPVLIDDEQYSASNAYGLTNVPSVFLIDPSGKIVLAEKGFSKSELETVDEQFRKESREPSLPLFTPSEIIPATKPG